MGSYMGECERSDQARLDRYELAEKVFSARVERLQQEGHLLKPTQITTEEAQEDHFDVLSALYRETCLEMGLA